MICHPKPFREIGKRGSKRVITRSKSNQQSRTHKEAKATDHAGVLGTWPRYTIKVAAQVNDFVSRISPREIHIWIHNRLLQVFGRLFKRFFGLRSCSLSPGRGGIFWTKPLFSSYRMYPSHQRGPFAIVAQTRTGPTHLLQHSRGIARHGSRQPQKGGLRSCTQERLLEQQSIPILEGQNLHTPKRPGVHSVDKVYSNSRFFPNA